MQEFELRDLIVETNEQYENAALTNRVACLVSVCFYILSLTCIGAIVVDQTLAVLNESGLFSNGGLL